MEFFWDRGNIDHIALHDITPDEAEQVIQNDPLELQKGPRNGELRITHLGETDTSRVLLVAITIRDEKIRVVTAYPAKKKMRDLYAQQKAMSDERHTTDT